MEGKALKNMAQISSASSIVQPCTALYIGHRAGFLALKEAAPHTIGRIQEKPVGLVFYFAPSLFYSFPVFSSNAKESLPTRPSPNGLILALNASTISVVAVAQTLRRRKKALDIAMSNRGPKGFSHSGMLTNGLACV